MHLSATQVVRRSQSTTEDVFDLLEELMSKVSQERLAQRLGPSGAPRYKTRTLAHYDITSSRPTGQSCFLLYQSGKDFRSSTKGIVTRVFLLPDKSWLVQYSEGSREPIIQECEIAALELIFKSIGFQGSPAARCMWKLLRLIYPHIRRCESWLMLGDYVRNIPSN